MTAANTKMYPEITGEMVAKNLTKNDVDKGRYMIYRKKPWLSETEK